MRFQADQAGCILPIMKMLLQERSGSVMDRVLQDLLRRTFLNDHTAIHEDDTIGHFAGKTHFVGDDQHRHVLGGQLLHDGIDFVDELRIERRCRLVEEHHLRLHGQRARNRDTLLLAAGQPRWIGVDLVGEPHLGQGVPSPVHEPPASSAP